MGERKYKGARREVRGLEEVESKVDELGTFE